MRGFEEIAQMREWNVVILTDSNSAADNVVQTIAEKEYITVRVHPIC